VRHREFITLLGGAAAAWATGGARAQSAMPVIGFLNGQTASGFEHLVATFKRGLGETGYVEGRNVAIEYHWADGQQDRLPPLANDLVRPRPSSRSCDRCSRRRTRPRPQPRRLPWSLHPHRAGQDCLRAPFGMDLRRIDVHTLTRGSEVNDRPAWAARLPSI
jgi:hypothetical protein